MRTEEPVGNLDGISEEPLGNLDPRASLHENLRTVLEQGPCTPYALVKNLTYQPGFPDFAQTRAWLSQFLGIKIPNDETGIVVLVGDVVQVATETRDIFLRDRPYE